MIDEATDELPLGREVRVEHGLFIERRCFLAATAGALAGAGFLPGTAYARLLPGDSISFEEFLASVLPEAKRLVADTSAAGQDVYLKTLAEHAVRLSDAPRPSWNDSGQSLTPGTFIGANAAPSGGTTEPFVVLHWRMDAGTRVETHAHTYGNVCTLGLEGEVQVSNFEMLGARDFELATAFVARRTVLQDAGPGIGQSGQPRPQLHPWNGGRAKPAAAVWTSPPGSSREGPECRTCAWNGGVRALAEEFDAVWTDLPGMKGQDVSLPGGA